MQYASTERNFGQVAEQNFYDAVLAHGDGTLVNAPSDNTLRGNITSYDGFCICRYVDIFSVSFIGFVTCTTITWCVVLFVAFTKYQNRQRQERRVGRSQVTLSRPMIGLYNIKSTYRMYGCTIVWIKIAGKLYAIMTRIEG